MGIGTFKDKNGRTRYRVTFSRNGRRLVDERLPPGTSREKAEAYNARIVGQWFDSNRLGIQEIPLIAEVIREYETRIRPRLKSPRYFTHNVQAIMPHVIGRTMDQLPEVGQAVAKALQAQSAATVWHRVSFLKTLAKYALKWRMVKHDYGIAVEVTKPNNARHHYIGKVELAKILRHASRPVRRACWQLFYTGMRRGELYAADLHDGCYFIPTTKNGDPRIVPIPDAVSRFAGKPEITRNPLSKAFKRACKASGFGHLTLHDLRHSNASQLLNAGIELRTVGMILGHRSAQSTNRYAHLAVETQRAAMNFAARQRQVSDPTGRKAGTRPAAKLKKTA